MGESLRCPFCHEEVVVCAASIACEQCGALQHDGCWAEHGACAACRQVPLLKGWSRCPACSAAVEPERSVCPGCGGVLRFLRDPSASGRLPARPGLPFQDERAPLVRSYLKTLEALALSPRASLRDLDPEEELLGPLKFLTCSVALFAFLGAVLSFTLGEGARTLVLLVLPMAGCFYALYFGALALHASCVVWRARDHGLGGTMVAWGYLEGLWLPV